jgi:hypothetical protein
MPPAPRSSGALRPKMRGSSCNGFILQLQTDGVLDSWVKLLHSTLADCYGSSADEKFYRGSIEFRRVPESGRDDWLHAHITRLSEIIGEEDAQLAACKADLPCVK